MRVRGQRRHQRGMQLLDLLERQPVRALHQVDQAEVPRPQDDRLVGGRLGALRVGGLVAAAGRLVDGAPHPRGVLVPRVELGDPAVRQRPLHELGERVAVALLEGRALRLPVVGQDDDLVGPRREAARAVDHPEALVQLAQRLEGVGALEARVVRHLVVAGERRVHRRHAAEHVLEHREGDQVADEHAHPGAQERVRAAAVTARLHVTPALPRGGDQLQQDLPEEQHERAGGVRGVGEERAVAGIGPLLVRHPAGGQQRLVRLARQEVAAAGPAVRQQPDPGRVGAFDLRAVAGVRAAHHAAGGLVDPPECGDVGVAAEQDPRLAGPGLR